MTDTQRTDMLGCYGNKDMVTPCLDKMAREGLRFDRAYTTQPVCGPARSALFTGLYPHSNGMVANSMALGDNVKTIGQRLQDAGVHTAYIGKWHLDGSDYFGTGQCPDGWDPKYWYDMRNFLEELTDERRLMSRKPESMDTEHIPKDFPYGYKCTKRAIDFLKQNGNEDFLLVVSYDEPHHPFLCPTPYSHMYDSYEFPKSDNVWDTLETKPSHQKVWAGDRRFVNRDDIKIKESKFFGCNSYIDSQIGRVLDAIEKYTKDALVIYTSDHGDMLESHCLNGKGPVSYEEITRIPMIVKWNGRIEPSSVEKTPVSHIDIMPTIMDAMEQPQPQWIEGKSLRPRLEGKSEMKLRNIYMEFTRYEIDHDGFGGFQPMRCVMDGRYKLTINLLCEDELYDLCDDPQEMHNLIDSDAHKKIRNRLHDSILEWMNDTRDPYRGYHWHTRKWRTDSPAPTWRYTKMTRQRQHEEYEPRQMEYKTGLTMKNRIREN